MIAHRTLSVITPFFRGNSYINHLGDLLENNALRLLEKDPSSSAEWLIVNDSPDCQVDLMNTWNDLDVKVINLSENGGIHHARQEGLKRAGGKYILFLDQDDEISPDYFWRQIGQMTGDTDVSVCNAKICHRDGSSEAFYKKKAEMDEVRMLPVYLRVRNPIVSPGQCLIKRKSIPGEWSSLQMGTNGSDDLLLWIMMLANNAVFSTLPECLYTHSYTGANVSESLEQITKSSMEVVSVLCQTRMLSKEQLEDLQHSVEWGNRSSAENRKYYLKNFRLFRTRLWRKICRKFSSQLV